MNIPHRLQRLSGERMTKSLRKNIFREIRGTWKRFLSIALMAFLGAGFFAGINASSTDMQLSCDTYLDEQRCFDLEVMSTLGLTDEDIDAILQVNGIEAASGVYSENVWVDISNGEEKVKLMTIPEKDDLNQLYLVDGRMAEQADECVVPQSLLNITGKKIGDQLEMTETLEEDEESSFRYTNLTITGVVDSPLFLFSSSGSNERSTGGVADYLYVPVDNVKEDVFTEIYATVDGAVQLDSFDDAYKTRIENTELLLKAIADEREQARYDQITGEAYAEIDDAQLDLDEETAKGQRELDDAQKKLDDAWQKIEDGREELDHSRVLAQQKFADAQAEIDSAESKISDSWRQYRRSEAAAKKQRADLVQQRKTTTEQLGQLKQTREETIATLADLENQRIEAQQTLDDLQVKRTEAEEALAPLLEQQTTLTDAIAQYQQMLDTYTEQLAQAQLEREQLVEAGMDTTELDAHIEQLTAEIAQIETEKAAYEAQLEPLNEGVAKAQEGLAQIVAGMEQTEAGIVQLDDGIQQAQNGLSQLDSGIAQAEDGLVQIADGIRQIDAGLASGKRQIQAAEAELATAKRELSLVKADTYAQLDAAEQELDEGEKELEDGRQELAVQQADFDQQIADAQKEIDEAREEVGDINRPTWYVLTRDGNSGISSFDQDSSNLKKIGFTFPWIFFLVAVLISLSSMTRMVEEQRGLIGTFQALGYSGGQIAAKYLIYAGAATVIGAVIGELVLMQVIPQVIWNIYRTMYHVPAFFTPIDWFYGILGLLACAGCIVGATAAACWKEVQQTPAQLMRPKAPNPGKRVLLERITPLWKRFNFSQKVTLRNLFRYKKRFFMTICGIAGCAALITTGFGLRDSIVELIPMQYEHIMHYDLIAATGTDVDEQEFEQMANELRQQLVVEDVLEIHVESIKIVTESGKSQELELFVPSDAEAFRNYFSLYDAQSEQELTLSGNEIILTQQMAEILQTSVGDSLSLRRDDGSKADVTVRGIVRNYLNHYAFLSKEGYEQAYGETANDNAFMLHTTEPAGKQMDHLTTQLNNDSRYTAVSSTQEAKDAVDDRFSLLDQVVWILIVAAAALAMVVLYNLSNINISERIRELATVKVLGFYDLEVYQYNTRESIILTLIGTLAGLAGGRGLTAFILKTMEMQGIVFDPTVAGQSYVIAGAITIVFATIINFMSYFALKKINMVEALKSVE